MNIQKAFDSLRILMNPTYNQEKIKTERTRLVLLFLASNGSVPIKESTVWKGLSRDKYFGLGNFSVGGKYENSAFHSGYLAGLSSLKKEFEKLKEEREFTAKEVSNTQKAFQKIERLAAKYE